MDGKQTSRLSLPECTERMMKTMMTPLNHTILNQEQENMCRTIWLLLCLLQTSVCLLSMRTNTCKTITQSKKKYMLSAFHFLPNLISYVYNYMLIFYIASLLLWCSELVSRRFLDRSLQSSPSVCPSAGLFTPGCSKGIGVPVIRALSHFG